MNKNILLWGTIVLAAVAIVVFIYPKIPILGNKVTPIVTPSITATVTATPSPTPVVEYTSSRAKVKFTFKTPLYVVEQLPEQSASADPIGVIFISKYPITDDLFSGLEVNYQTPSMDAGGACSTAWKTLTIGGRTIQVCENGEDLSSLVGLRNATAKIDYAVWITKGERAFNAGEYAFYKDILLHGMTYTK